MNADLMPVLPHHASVAPETEVHLGDNYLHLLVATADMAGRPVERNGARRVLFSTDGLPLPDPLRRAVAELTGAAVDVVSDRQAIDEYARLPRWAPGILRRNLSWTSVGRPIGPSRWTPAFLAGARFGTGYVYHPGFFLSKVMAGRCDQIVMRDSGYANYVSHRVPWSRRLPRLLARRPGRVQVYGEEPWIDRIEVARPDLLPAAVRTKASQLTLDQLGGRLDPRVRERIAHSFWGDQQPIALAPGSSALLLTQPLAELGMCTPAAARSLYERLVERLEARGHEVVVKPHPRETGPILPDRPTIPAAFPIEAWTWLGRDPFDVAVSLNSTALSGERPSFAHATLQLVERDRFYPQHRDEWPGAIDHAFRAWTSP